MLVLIGVWGLVRIVTSFEDFWPFREFGVRMIEGEIGVLGLALVVV